MGRKVPHQREVRLQLFEKGFPEISPGLSFDLVALDRPLSKPYHLPQFPPPGWGRARVGVIYGNFSHLQGD
jgi:hypothetical protein